MANATMDFFKLKGRLDMKTAPEFEIGLQS